MGFTQETGIRQGCPMSPYLFILVMHVMFEDVRRDLDATVPARRGGLVRGQPAFGHVERPEQNYVQNANFHSVLYADDTICVTRDSAATQYLIRSIEKIGAQFGLRLNKKKCVMIKYNTDD